MIDSSLETILAYLREHSGLYTLAELRERLLRDGCDPATVDRAIAVFQEQPDPLEDNQLVWPKTLVVMAVNAVLMAVAVEGLISGPGGPRDDHLKLIGVLLSIVGGGELLVGIVLTQREESRAWGRALGCAFLPSIGLGILAVCGLCVYLFNQGMRGH